MRREFLLAAALAAAPLYAAEPDALRLGDVATPTAYQLQLSVDPAQPTFGGEVRIDLLVNRETNAIRLNAQDLEIESASFTQGEMPIPVAMRREGEDRVVFEATGEKFVFGTTTAVIRYRGRIEPNGARGLFRRNESGEWYVVSQFEAMNARRAIPTFDEPGWKTPWDVSIDAPAASRVFANSREAAIEDAPGRAGWKRHRFERTPPLPSYLVAMAIGPFDILDGGTAGSRRTPLRYVAPKDRAMEARFAHESTPRILELLEDYFGGPFPFGKLDTVSLAGAVRFGAMENAGMITYEPGLLLARPQDDSLAFRRRYVSVGAHEIAHQWFGDLVTLAWWDDVWLNEAFATWAARKTSRAYRPEWEGGWRYGDVRRRALLADRLTSARQVRNPVRERNDMEGAFDQITYSKGAEVISMFESSLGEAAFQRGVRDYMARHAGGNATSDDFFAAIGRAAGGGRTVEAFRTFVDQPGLPLVDVALACERGTASLRVSQRRFAGLGQAAGTQRWITPACFRYRAGGRSSKQCVEISGDATIALEAPGCPDWIVGNADGAGHWVARYDAALARNLEARIVDVPEREAVAFAGDTALLVNSGLMRRDEGFRRADAFLRHPSVGVRHGAIEFLDSQREEMLAPVHRQARHLLLVSYVLPMARSFGWIDRPTDDLPTQEMRAAVMAYAARMPGGESLRGAAREAAMRWVDDRKAVPASSLPAVLQTASRFADAATFERLADAFARTRQQHERQSLVSALAVVRDPALRMRVLEAALREAQAGGYEPSETLMLLERMLFDEAGRTPGFAYLREHWDAAVAKLPPESAARLIDPLANLCTRRDRQDFVAFFEPRIGQLRGAPRKYAQALESIDVCVAAVAASSAERATVTAPAKKPRPKGRAGRARSG